MNRSLQHRRRRILGKNRQISNSVVLPQGKIKKEILNANRD